jgi:hypothetical protein
MRMTDGDCDEFRRSYLLHEGVELTRDEVREVFSRLSFLFERFAAWVAKEKAGGRNFESEIPSGNGVAFLQDL